jgi:hypothetical protein
VVEARWSRRGAITTFGVALSGAGLSSSALLEGEAKQNARKKQRKKCKKRCKRYGNDCHQDCDVLSGGDRDACKQQCDTAKKQCTKIC